MVDMLTILLSHGMIAFVIWRVLKTSDPEAMGREAEQARAKEMRNGRKGLARRA